MTGKKEDQSYILTVAVPTYRRLRYLKELLPQLITQSASLQGQVQLLVVDNFSDDGTEDYVRGEFEGLSWCEYSRNSSNIGGDRNFLHCIELARGDYVWLFGDDEILIPGALKRIVSELDRNKPSIIISTHKLRITRRYANYRRALCGSLPWHWSFVLHHTLITASVFRRELFDLAFANEMLHTNYAHIYGLRSVWANQGGCVVVLSQARRLYSVRPVRAEFDVHPDGLEGKLKRLLIFISRESGSFLLFAYGVFFFNVLNPIKGWIMMNLRKLKRFPVVMRLRAVLK